MKSNTLLVLFLLMSFLSMGQAYNTALGVRLSPYVSENSSGNTFGITLQQRITQRITLEVIGEMRNDQPVVTGLLEYHRPIIFKGFNLYAGIGGNTNLSKVDVRDFSYGLDVVLGAELKLPFLPLVVSYDVKPALLQTFNLGVKDAFELDWRTGLSVRAVLFSEEQKKKRLKRQKKALRQDKRENFIEDLKEKNPVKKKN